MTKQFENKVAMVTGAGSGIGEAIARRMAEEGATVVVADVNEKAAREVAAAIEREGRTAAAVLQDVADPASVEKSVDFSLEKFGRLDVAVNNAGITGDLAPLADYSLEGWNKVIAVNLSGVFYGMKYQIPAMLRSGGGSIVNIASILGSVAARDSAGYNAAKHGVVGLTKSAALEYSAEGIRVNAIGPGYINTPLLKALDKEVYDGLVDSTPSARLDGRRKFANWRCFWRRKRRRS